jgi:hypothetical protein
MGFVQRDRLNETNRGTRTHPASHTLITTSPAVCHAKINSPGQFLHEFLLFTTTEASHAGIEPTSRLFALDGKNGDNALPVSGGVSGDWEWCAIQVSNL